MFDQLAFVSPALLGFLGVLPLIWWLLRLTPPSPRRIIFPALEFFRNPPTIEETPARTPWWVLLLRLFLVGLTIIAFAEPVIDPVEMLPGQSPMLVVIDNDWAAARDWDMRQHILHQIFHEAERAGRPLILLTTTPDENGGTLDAEGPLAPQAADGLLKTIKAQPWFSDWGHVRSTIEHINPATFSETIWLSSGVGSSSTKNLYDILQKVHPLHVFSTRAPIYSLSLQQDDQQGPSLIARRAATDDSASLTIDAVARDGNIVGRLPITFSAGSPRALSPMSFPLDVRNEITRFSIEDPLTAAGTVLLDSGWQHHSVGLVGNQAELEQHSLLSSLYYIDRALKPYADLHVEALDTLLKEKVSVLILSDTTILNKGEIDALKKWIEQGGVLLRFAGETFVGSENPDENDLLPVTLRTGDRAMGGALSWATPQRLHAFPPSSPFAGIAIPDDVTINRQVLAEPDNDLPQKTWAALEDGTPLVTAKALGQGLTILFHIPARSDWSNMPLSGLFVDMLRRIVDLSSGNQIKEGSTFTVLPPFRLLNAFGAEGPVTPLAEPLHESDLIGSEIGPKHPPGLYGSITYSRALNLGTSIGQPELLTDIPVSDFASETTEYDLKPILLVAVFIGLIVDFLISLRLRGLLPRFRPWVLVLTCLIVMGAQRAHADDEKTALELTSKTYIAHVHTGDHETDATVESGLTTLARVLQLRTSIDQVGVAEVDPERDDLVFFPLIYWPLIPNQAPLSATGALHVNEYLHHGGMILFDTMNGDEPSPVVMRRILAGVDMPPLIRLPEDHVLKRSFYLINEVPGRFAREDFWLEPEEASSYDGVATVLFGSNGWAAAWATTGEGKALFPCTPGGEIQREQSLRFGINLVMYALTGNYKSDQLHMQALLEKMGK